MILLLPWVSGFKPFPNIARCLRGFSWPQEVQRSSVVAEVTDRWLNLLVWEDFFCNPLAGLNNTFWQVLVQSLSHPKYFRL